MDSAVKDSLPLPTQVLGVLHCRGYNHEGVTSPLWIEAVGQRRETDLSPWDFHFALSPANSVASPE